MNKDAKRINPASRPQIDTLKNNIRWAKNPFDGTGYVFKTAIKELKKEGLQIIYDKEKARFYNKNQVSAIWGY